MIRSTIILSILSLSLTASLWAADGDPSLRFRNISRGQGLSNVGITAIMQDSRGFMWFGTLRGLNRWDGRTMRVFYHSLLDSTTIPSPKVSAIAETPDGNIWVGSPGKGLAMLDPRLERFTRYQYNPDDSTSLSDNRITALQVDTEGRLWVGTQSGLCYLNPGAKSFTRFQYDPELNTSIPNNWITAMEVDTEGILWIGANSGHVFSLAPGVNDFKTIKYGWFKPSVAGTNVISDLVMDPNGNDLWVSMAPIGVFRYSKITGEVTKFRAGKLDPKMVNKNAIYSLECAQDGRLWLGNLNGVSLLDPKTGNYSFIEPNPNTHGSIRANYCGSMLFDSQGIIWIGSATSGVDVCNPQQLRFQSLKQPETEYQVGQWEWVLDLDVDRQDRIWTAGAGFHRTDLVSGDTKSFQTDDTNPAVWSMNYGGKVMVDQQDRVWMGTNGAGLFRWDPKTDNLDHYRKYRLSISLLSHNYISALYETLDGTVWVGTLGGGLHRYQPETDDFEFIQHDPDDPYSLAGNNIMTIFEDQRSDLWVGTADAGLDRLDQNTGMFQHFRAGQQNNSITSDAVYTFYEDRHSTLWIGTSGGGLCTLDSSRQNFEVIDLGFDPEGMSVAGILEDDQGLFWISSNWGILKFDPENGRVLGVYQESDGALGLNFLADSRAKDSNGTMYFGSFDGLNFFHPDSIEVNDHIPPIVLTDLWVNHERVRVGDEINQRIILPESIEFMDTLHLSYRDKVIRFEFVALDYWNPDLNQYRYMLEGFDPDWVAAGNTNMVTYTSLDPGWCTLRVQGSNNDRIWNERGVNLAVFIKPPFWKTGLFRIFMILLILSIFMGIMWLRNWRLRVQNQKLEALVRQRTAELKVEMEARSRAKQEHLRRELLTKTLHLNEKQQIVDHLQLDLTEIAGTIPADSRSRINKLIRFLKSHTTAKQGWDDFELWFTEVHTNFYINLREASSGLSESELKVCALLRLNLVTKDVAKVMNIQTASINIYRHRIRKKLNLRTEENLTTFLSQF